MSQVAKQLLLGCEQLANIFSRWIILGCHSFQIYSKSVPQGRRKGCLKPQTVVCADASRQVPSWEKCWKLSSDSQNLNDLPVPVPAPSRAPKTQNRKNKKLLLSISNNLKDYCKPHPLPTSKFKVGISALFSTLMDSLFLCQLIPTCISALPPTHRGPHLRPTVPQPRLKLHWTPLFSFLPLNLHNDADYLYLLLFIH